ncbi:unnamed protein product, partial [Mesorhabditis spiculigera]
MFTSLIAGILVQVSFALAVVVGCAPTKSPKERTKTKSPSPPASHVPSTAPSTLGASTATSLHERRHWKPDQNELLPPKTPVHQHPAGAAPLEVTLPEEANVYMGCADLGPAAMKRIHRRLELLSSEMEMQMDTAPPTQGEKRVKILDRCEVWTTKNAGISS